MVYWAENAGCVLELDGQRQRLACSASCGDRKSRCVDDAPQGCREKRDRGALCTVATTAHVSLHARASLETACTYNRTHFICVYAGPVRLLTLKREPEPRTRERSNRRIVGEKSVGPFFVPCFACAPQREVSLVLSRRTEKGPR